MVRESEGIRGGRFARTALFAVLAGGWGQEVFGNIEDPVLAVPFFLASTLAVLALGHELHTQARRRSPVTANRWEGTDTAIVAVLVGLALATCVALASRSFTPSEQSIRASYAAMYVLLAGCFGLARRATLAAR